MSYIITDYCTACGICKEDCPVSCILEGPSKYVILEGACIECGNCAAVCPVGAPEPSE